MFNLITGGSGSGKSEYAEGIIESRREKDENAEMLYVATMMPFGEETRQKIERHRRMRAGKGFRTVECYVNLRENMEKVLEDVTEPRILLECMSNLAANEMFAGMGEDPAAEEPESAEQIVERIMEGIRYLKEHCRDLVVVTNEVFSEGAEDSPEMQRYRQVLGRVNCRMAQLADKVTEIVYGIPVEPGKNPERCAGESAYRPAQKIRTGGRMQMIIGGACQGKLAYAKRKYPNIRWTDGTVCERKEIFTCEGIFHLEAYIRRFMKRDELPENLAEELIRKNPGIVMISNEIGYGLVPVDDFERRYREETGRICTRLAAYSECVDRVVCGIGMTIKEDRAEKGTK